MIVPPINLYEYQKEAVENLNNGSILIGRVGSGKSLTALYYYFSKVCKGKVNPLVPMEQPMDLYIITTARKRDTLEWEKECNPFMLSKKKELSINNVALTIDSWNNISKYSDVKNAFFIFDEQRVVGAGAWVKSFLSIAKKNQWVLLSATPGDSWMDYVPVFIANGFFKNRTEFIRSHVIFNRFVSYPQVERYIDTYKLLEYKQKILVPMNYTRNRKVTKKNIYLDYNKDEYEKVFKLRWNIYKNEPIKNASEFCLVLRKIVNGDASRVTALNKIFKDNKKLILFYNFNYELDILRQFAEEHSIPFGEWNGHKHQPIPSSDTWLYLVQYTSGAEGWNCIETDSILFYSQNYSYKIMEQAAGRIDRLNSPFKELKYYYFMTNSTIDLAIKKSLDNKKEFNYLSFAKQYYLAS